MNAKDKDAARVLAQHIATLPLTIHARPRDTLQRVWGPWTQAQLDAYQARIAGIELRAYAAWERTEPLRIADAARKRRIATLLRITFLIHGRQPPV